MCRKENKTIIKRVGKYWQKNAVKYQIKTVKIFLNNGKSKIVVYKIIKRHQEVRQKRRIKTLKFVHLNLH